VRFVRHDKPATDDGGGFVGTPQQRDWLEEWIEKKGCWADLECGCKADLTDRGLLVIGAFKDAEVLCERHNRFARVTGTHKPARTVYPQTPLF
jgi:hypothetical protein